jgi:hypothetical protein
MVSTIDVQTTQVALTADQFDAQPEFDEFKCLMRETLQIPKNELDRQVKASKEASLRKNNPKAPGRKAKRRRRKNGQGPPTHNG